MVNTHTQNLVLIRSFRCTRALENPKFCTAKVEYGYTTTDLPLSNSIKIISILQWLHGEIVHTNSVLKSVTNIWANRQKNSSFLATLAEAEVRAQPTLAQ